MCTVASLHKHFASQAQTPCDDEYPPLPAYQSDSEVEKKEVYIVQVKGIPWSCTPDELLYFFSGETSDLEKYYYWLVWSLSVCFPVFSLCFHCLKLADSLTVYHREILEKYKVKSHKKRKCLLSYCIFWCFRVSDQWRGEGDPYAIEQAREAVRKSLH